MKSSFKRTLAFILSLLLLVGVAPIDGLFIKASAAGMTLAQLQAKFPQDRYWNGGNADLTTGVECTCHNKGICVSNTYPCTCNHFEGGCQCNGFARKIGYDAYGKHISTWEKKYNRDYAYSLKPGDIVYNSSPHWFMVIKVFDDYVIVGECNHSARCQITWERRINKSTIYGYSGLEFFVAPYRLGEGEAYSHKRNTNYGVNLTAYPKAKITSSDIFDEYHCKISSSSWIGTSDKCTIHEVYTDGCCKVTYPLDKGGTKTVYSKISLFNISSSGSFVDRLLDYIQNHTNNNTSETTSGYVSRSISDKGIAFLKAREGCPTSNGRAVAYKDSVGVWTIGYGHTGNVHSGDSISMQEAEQLFRGDLQRFESAVNAYLKKHNTFVTQYQYDALISFTHNTGEGWCTNSRDYPETYKFFQTNKHSYEEVLDRFLTWCNPKSLRGRRIMEANLYYNGDYNNSTINTDPVAYDNSGSISTESTKGQYRVRANGGLRVRSGPGTGYSIVGGLADGSTVAITAVSGSWGKCSTGWVNMGYLVFLGEPEPVIPVPAAPSLNRTSSGNIPVGTSVTVTWAPASDAVCYDIYLKNSAGTVCQQSIGNTGTNVAFTINDAGTYTITAVSRNTKHTSTSSNTISVTAHNPSMVTFTDWNGAVLSRQTVAYGKSATSPSNPSRYGWTFKRWNGSYTNVTSNQTVIAYYERNIYTVTFVDEVGAIIGNKQKIEFEGSATAPQYTPPEGYTFVRWDQDFSYIESNLTVRPVVVWSNDDLPITLLSTTTAVRGSTGYTINANVRNNPNNATDGRVIVALKTESGKLLSMTESAAFHLMKSADKTIEVFMPYDKAASVAEIYVVETFSTAIPISAVLRKTIDQGTAWSNWSTAEPPSEAYQVESRKEYRYKTKSTTTNSASSLPGWTKYNTTSEWSAYGDWSGWTDSYIAESDSRKVDTRSVTVSDTYTLVHMYHYKYWHSKTSEYWYTWSPNMGGTCERVAVTWDRLKSRSFDDGTAQSYYVDGSGRWYIEWEESVPKVEKTQYRYKDRSLIYTYYYYQWSDWSSWSTTAVTGTSTKEVEERTTYRYLANNPELVADNSGTERTITGNLDSSFAGEQAILFIYKVDEASDFTNEYVGQTVISNDGSYSFTFKLREEPSIKTGDFTVTLGIEGTNTALYLDPIEAPKPKYTVTYLDWDGTTISMQQVTEGEDAVMPESNPSREGYDFICWNNTATNIKDDMTVSPVYKIKSYTVVFVDWTKESVVMETYEHGQPLAPPEIGNKDDSYSVGWDAVIDGKTTVTQNMVVTAKYEKKVFTVSFMNEQGELMDSVNVEYGESVVMPESLENDNTVLLGWNPDGDTDFVVDNITVVPIFKFLESTETPTSTIDTGEYTEPQTVELICNTEGSSIYYTTDGSDPLENGIEYTEPFVVNSTTELRFCSCAFEHNNSEEQRVWIAINNPDDITHVIRINSNIDEIITTVFVQDGNTLDISQDALEIEGYTYCYALYYGDGYEEEFDAVNGTIDESGYVTLYWAPKKCTVTFIGFDNEILAVEEYDYLSTIDPPQCDDVDGYIFAGFDCDDYVVKGDMTLEARFVAENDYVAVSLNKTKCRLLKGTSLNLNASVSNYSNDDYTLLWASTDSSVVSVADDGTIYARGVGEATIYVLCEESGSVAECTVTVEASSDEEIVVKPNNGIGFDAANQIRGISVSNNKVSDVRKFFENEAVVFVDITGYVLQEDDLVGTGTRVRIMDGTTVIDEKTIVVTGDMNGDGKINNRDSSMIIRYLVDKEVASQAQLTAIDVNGDGYVNNRDASMVSRYLVGKETI